MGHIIVKGKFIFRYNQNLYYAYIDYSSNIDFGNGYKN